MPTNITMPALLPGVKECSLAKGVVRQSTRSTLATASRKSHIDKTIMEVDAIEKGRMGAILILEDLEEGKVKPVIAILVDDAEKIARPRLVGRNRFPLGTRRTDHGRRTRRSAA